MNNKSRHSHVWWVWIVFRYSRGLILVSSLLSQVSAWVSSSHQVFGRNADSYKTDPTIHCTPVFKESGIENYIRWKSTIFILTFTSTKVLIHRNQARSIKIGWFVLKYSIEFQNQNIIGLTVPPIWTPLDPHDEIELVNLCSFVEVVYIYIYTL